MPVIPDVSCQVISYKLTKRLFGLTALLVYRHHFTPVCPRRNNRPLCRRLWSFGASFWRYCYGLFDWFPGDSDTFAFNANAGDVTPIAFGETLTTTIETPVSTGFLVDIDAYSFTANAGAKIQISMHDGSTNSLSIDNRIQLYDLQQAGQRLSAPL